MKENNMARINIEDSIFKDERFIDYCIGCGDKDIALGRLIRFWMKAQKFYLTHGEIPNAEYFKFGLDENLVKTGLAERSSTGVRAKGQDQQFAWLKQTQQAGRASAKKRGNAMQKKQRTDVHKTTNARSTPVDGSSTSLLSSHYSLLTTQNSLNSTKYENSNFHREKIAAFCLGWKNKYNAQYKFIPKEIGLLKNQFKNTSLKGFEELVFAYFEMNLAKFVSKRHSFTEFYFSLQEINHFMQTGVRVSKHDANQIELQEHNKNIFSNIANERTTNES
jgi:hypothetical protein